jgi:diguanylate cyclase (GGDEF)-like protein/hemerythrin-like metal-binding protein
MDNSSLTFALSLEALAIAGLAVVIALFRRQRSSTIWASGYVSGMLGFFLIQGQGHIGPWLSVALADLLWLYLPAAQAWGLRTQLAFGKAWPWRFWAYMAAVLLAMTLWRHDYRLRFLVAAAASIAFAAEFLYAANRAPRGLTPYLRRLTWAIGLAYILAWAAGFLLQRGGSSLAGVVLDDSPAANYIISVLTFFLVIWAGLVMTIDISGLLEELEAKNRRLESLATTDELTGLPNRRGLDSLVDMEMERSQRYGAPLSLILFDLDHFKEVNDSCGHAAGDLVLKRCAAIALSLIRKPDHLMRWGGEEFVLVVPHAKLSDAARLAEKIRRSLAAETFPGVGQVTSSFGVAEWRQGDSFERWFQKVDEAVYKAKREGRNRVATYEEVLDLPDESLRLEWTADLESGDRIIDGEHRELLESCNRLMGLVLSKADLGLVLSGLDELEAEVVRHFRDEEEILSKSGYPDFLLHAAQHRELLEEAAALKASARKDGADASAFYAFLVGRVVNDHLLHSDTLFFPHTRRLHRDRD